MTSIYAYPKSTAGLLFDNRSGLPEYAQLNPAPAAVPWSYTSSPVTDAPGWGSVTINGTGLRQLALLQVPFAVGDVVVGYPSLVFKTHIEVADCTYNSGIILVIISGGAQIGTVQLFLMDPGPHTYNYTLTKSIAVTRDHLVAGVEVWMRFTGNQQTVYAQYGMRLDVSFTGEGPTPTPTRRRCCVC